MLKMKNNFQIIRMLFKNKIFLALVLNIFFCVYALVFGTIKFETNDDREICNILSDVYNCGQGSYIVFINIVIGYVLRFFYLIVPSINWYVIFSLIISFFSLTSITCCIYKKVNIYLGTLLNMAFLVMFYQESYVSFQYTKNAFLYLTAGLLLILTYYKEWEKNKIPFIGGTFLMIIGSLLRFQCFEGIVPFLILICFIELFYMNKRKCQQCIPLFCSLAISIVLIVGLRGFHIYKYESDPEWSYFREYNEKRAALTDYGTFPYENYGYEMEKAGISAEDYQLLMKWTYADTEVFSLNTLNKLTEIKNSHRTNRVFISMDLIIRFISSIIDICQEYLYLYSIVLLLFFIFLFNIKKTYPSILFLVVLFFEWYLYAWLERIVFRTLYGTILVGIVFALYYLLEICNDNRYCLYKIKIDNDTQRIMFWLFFLIILLCGIPQSMHMISNKVYFEENTEYEAMLKEVQSNKDILYLVDRPTLTIVEENYNPYKVIPQGTYENICVIGGWIYPTPQNNSALERFSITNPMAALASERHDIRLIDGIGPYMKHDYLMRHYESKIEPIIVKEYESFSIYIFQINESLQ